MVNERQRVQQWIKGFEFGKLFNELGWDFPQGPKLVEVVVKGQPLKPAV
jgi:hypothetical protein